MTALFFEHEGALNRPEQRLATRMAKDDVLGFLAASDGVSLNQFIAAAAAEKVGSLRAADDFLRERAGTAKPKDMRKPTKNAR